VAIAGGIVLPLEGRLSFIPLQAGGPKVDDYTRPLNPNATDAQKPPQWMHLEVLDDTQFIAVDSAGALMRFQYRTDPRPHLFEVRNLALKSPVNVPLAVSDGMVVFADAQRQLHVMDGQSFQILGSAPLEGDATNAVWMAGGKVYVETNRSQLSAYEITPQPKKLWTLSLENSGLAGSPILVGSMLLVAKQNGDVLLVDPAAGTVSERHTAGQSLVATPFTFGNHLLAPSLDGSLYSLESALMGGK
jgi:outer membrane protein assembly factor BamB